jgi:hypothetical protein
MCHSRRTISLFAVACIAAAGCVREPDGRLDVDANDAFATDVFTDIDGSGEALECSAAHDCGLHSICVEGACVDAWLAPCRDDADCGAADSCTQARCAPRERRTRDFRMRPVTLPGITDRVGIAVGSQLDFSVGAGLVDYDGDTLLDLVLASDADAGPSRCIYHNVSVPGRIAFESEPEVCLPADPMTASAFGIDLDGDGRDEYLELGTGRIVLHHRFPEARQTDLFALVHASEPGRDCVAGVALPMDFNADGRLDVLVGCQFDSWRGSGPLVEAADLADVLLLQNPSGELELAPDERWAPLQQGGVTLGLAAFDFNDDGLLDIVQAADTSSSPSRVNTGIYPGGFFEACSPLEDCTFRYSRLLDSVAAWGSYMGVGVVTSPSGDAVYVTNWGDNRFLSRTADGWVDHAVELGVNFRGVAESWQYSWAAIVDDFDRNGLDDVYVGRGRIHSFSFPDQYRDVLLLQYGDRLFDQHLDVRPDFGQWQSFELPQSRGGARADLDHDGALDLILATPTRSLAVFSEVVDGIDEPRCTLVPRPSVVTTHGVGYRVADTWSRRFRVRDVQGQHRFGQSGQIFVSFNRGTLRFPSGAEVDFDCGGTPGPVTVTEPDWITVEAGSTALRLQIHAPWLVGAVNVTVAVDRGGAIDEFAASQAPDGSWVVAGAADADRVMLRINGRWVARWWPI